MKALVFAVFACVLMPVVALAQEGQGQAPLNSITAVNVRDGTVEIVGTKKPNFTMFTLPEPFRLVIDISEAVFTGVKEDISVGNGTISGIRTASYGSDETAIARVVIGYERDVETDIQARGNSLVVSVVGGGGAAVAASATPPGGAAGQATPETPGGTAAQAAVAARVEEQQQERAAAQAAVAAEVGEQERAAAQAAVAARVEEEQQQRAAAQAAAAARAEAEAQRQAQARAEAERQAQEESARVAARQAEQQRLAEERAAKAAAATAEKQRRADEARAAAEERKRQQAEARERQRAEAQAAAEERRRQQAEERQARLAQAETSRRAPEQGERLAGALNKMTLVGFKQEPTVSRVFIRTDEPVTFNVTEGNRVVVLELEDTRIDMARHARRLDTSFFDTAVASVNAEAGPARSALVTIRLKEQVSYQTRQEGNELFIEFQRPAGR